jgi:hypothetical protein
MDNLSLVAQILTKAGYILNDCTNGYLCITDPTCIWPPLLNFINTAWIILSVATGFLLAGWGITMVRGANHDIVKNLRTLVLIFGTLSVAIPAVNVLGAGKAIVGQCDIIKVSQEQVNELVNLNNESLTNPDYESFEIIDSAVDEFNF